MPAPHALLFGAIALGGVAAVAYAIYKEIQEQEFRQQQYEQYQNYARQRREDLFRFTNDFDFENDEGEEEDEKKSSHQESPQLRHRRPHSNNIENDQDRRKSLEKDQYELFELENSISERKRRLLAEQAFLDREEALLRSRQNELMKSEQLFNEMSTTTLHHHPTTTNTTSDSNSEFYNPFSDRYGQDVSSFFDAQDSSEHSENTAILIENDEQQAATVPSQENTTLSSSDLQLPDVSHHIESSSQATTDTEDHVVSSHATSDSEESWDAVSDNEWNQSIDNATDNSQRRHSIRSISDTASLTDDEAL